MTVSLVQADAGRLPLADSSVHLIVSSPPYFSLRSYRDGDAHYDGQLGSEPTPHHFLANLWAVLDECWRVLRDDGSCWLNLGDKYAGGGPGGPSASSSTVNAKARFAQDSAPRPRPVPTSDIRPKSRMLLPHRFALGLIDPEYRQWTEYRAGLRYMAAGGPKHGQYTGKPLPQWICRIDAVWSKPNGLPESVTDRVRASHEYWLHFTKSERYYSALDAIREPQMMTGGEDDPAKGRRSGNGVAHRTFTPVHAMFNPLGKLPGSVWEVPSEPLLLPADLPQHWAAFPSEFPRRLVLGWSPSGVCVRCGEGRRPVCERERTYTHARYDGSRSREAIGGVTNSEGRAHAWLPGRDAVTITGTACVCPPGLPDAPTTPARVLDPFSGTGTAPIVAAALGRHGIGADLSWDYHRIARWRHRDGGLRAKALGVDRPERQLPGQLSLLEGLR